MIYNWTHETRDKPKAIQIESFVEFQITAKTIRRIYNLERWR